MQKNGKKGRKPKKPYVPDASEGAFVRSLLAEGFAIERMPGDGNCMFHSLGHQLFGDSNQHMHIRNTIMDYIESREDHFELFIEDDETFEEYVTRLRTFGEWGDHTELYAATQCYKVDIIVHQADAPNYMLSGSEPGAVPRVIHLSFHGECHYNSVMPIANKLSTTQEPSGAPSSSLSVPQYAMDVVARAVPWVDDQAIEQALRSTGNYVDNAIELLCSGAAKLNISEETKAEAPSITVREEGCKAKDKAQEKKQEMPVTGTEKESKKADKGKSKAKAVNLPKKERRKLEKAGGAATTACAPQLSRIDSSASSVLHLGNVIAI